MLVHTRPLIASCGQRPPARRKSAARPTTPRRGFQARRRRGAVPAGASGILNLRGLVGTQGPLTCRTPRGRRRRCSSVPSTGPAGCHATHLRARRRTSMSKPPAQPPGRVYQSPERDGRGHRGPFGGKGDGIGAPRPAAGTNEPASPTLPRMHPVRAARTNTYRRPRPQP